jgi:hypothetical protein
LHLEEVVLQVEVAEVHQRTHPCREVAEAVEEAHHQIQALEEVAVVRRLRNRAQGEEVEAEEVHPRSQA